MEGYRLGMLPGVVSTSRAQGLQPYNETLELRTPITAPRSNKNRAYKLRKYISLTETCKKKESLYTIEKRTSCRTV
jgi:hypothetical protein